MTKRLTKQQIDNICNVLTSGYLEKRLIEGKDASKIDIEDFVVSYLGCTVVFECIAEDYDCMGYASDGIQPLCVCRNGRKEEVVFPKDTIVIDNDNGKKDTYNLIKFKRSNNRTISIC